MALLIKLQGTDTAILVIAIATVYTLTRRGAVSSVPEQRWRYGQIFLICVSVWALPFFTGGIITAFNMPL